jgi:hypothetical protein
MLNLLHQCNNSLCIIQRQALASKCTENGVTSHFGDRKFKKIKAIKLINFQCAL